MTVEELRAYGVEYMSEEAIGHFIDNRSTGVLGLARDGRPYLVPMAYAFDGDSSLYFTYVSGEESIKQELTDRNAEASFLVYSADTIFHWESVQLDGKLRQVSAEELEDIEDLLESIWKPAKFRGIDEQHQVVVYEFEIRSKTGLKHVGLTAQD